MQRFIRSRIVLTLAAFLIIAAAIVISLSGSLTHTRAQAPATVKLSPSSTIVKRFPGKDSSPYDSSVTVNVDGTQPWTDTGIDLSSGNAVTITASGTVYFAAGPALPYGPDGNTSCTAGPDFTAPGLHCFSLVGNIANGTPFQVGSNNSILAASGRLYLGVNDNVFTDNSGSWSATVTITTSGGIVITSTTGWQQTPVTVQPGDQYSISYISGKWTVDVRNLAYVDPNGYPPNIDQQIYQGCKVNTSLVYATLLGRIGTGSNFKVGTGGTFTASTSGVLSLRINDQNACLGDNAGAIVLKVTPPPKYIEAKNLTWGGYITSFTNPQNTPISVSAAWAVPSISCTRNGTAISGYLYVWDGLGGYQSGNNLEQIGTASQCINGSATYWAWYEFVPSMSSPYHIINDGNYPISAHDAMRADITEQGSGYFVLRIFDDTKGWYYPKIWIDQSSNAIPQTGEWIVEHPANGSLPFPKFKQDIVFTNCYWVQNGPQQPLNTGSNLTRATIYTVGSGNQPVLPLKELTYDIQQDGTDFSVHWKTY